MCSCLPCTACKGVLLRLQQSLVRDCSIIFVAPTILDCTQLCSWRRRSRCSCCRNSRRLSTVSCCSCSWEAFSSCCSRCIWARASVSARRARKRAALLRRCSSAAECFLVARSMRSCAQGGREASVETWAQWFGPRRSAAARGAQRVSGQLGRPVSALKRLWRVLPLPGMVGGGSCFLTACAWPRTRRMGMSIATTLLCSPELQPPACLQFGGDHVGA